VGVATILRTWDRNHTEIRNVEFVNAQVSSKLKANSRLIDSLYQFPRLHT
jgi:hypothetical protein